MKLIFVGYLHGFGGAEKMEIKLANAMVERGHEVTFISLVSNNLKYDISNKINYIYIADKGNNKIRILFNRYKRLKEILSREQHDVSIHFWLQSAYLSAFMGKKIARKVIYSERGDPSDKEYENILGVLRSIAFCKIGGVVFQSRGARDYFSDKIKKKSCVIHNPVFLRAEDYSPPVIREKRIVTTGRLHEQKNQKLLIDAFASLPENKSEFSLEIYGEGELRKKLQEQIDALGLQNRVFLKGAFKDVHKRIVGASLFVLSSDYEGMPNALLEAMVLGLPCVSTDCKPGGARELIQSGENGIIVPCGSVKELTEMMNEVLSNVYMANKLGENAKKVIKNANPNIVFNEWEKFFEMIKC